ncbi:unnamed protein product [Larinioides sclopetarius]|uniref:Uncharacterized protein n=1 Tax=Larinioides sclopetarius TaxID=280406 RepID=A0AAV1ZU89_9ARAC
MHATFVAKRFLIIIN